MRVFRVFAVVALAVVLAGLIPARAAASCAEMSIAERAEQADVVVYGTVTEIRPITSEIGVVRFRVERVLKGTPPAEIDVAIGPTTGPVTGVDYVGAQRGQTHTLYLYSADNDPWTTDVCSGSHSGAPTLEETAYFGPGREPAVPGPGSGPAVPTAARETAFPGTRSSAPPKDDMPFVVGAFAIVGIAIAAAVFARRATLAHRR